MQRQIKGFTLLEILLVIAVIGILASIILVAINPTRQVALAQNARRSTDVGAIYKAVDQYTIKNQNLPSAIQAMGTGFANRVDICKPGQSALGCINISTDLVPNFLANMPADPSQSTTTSTRYSVVKNLNDTIAIRSETAALGKEIIAGVILDIAGLNAPSAITDLNATVIGGNSVNLTWSAPSSPLPIQEYIILYSSGQDFSSQTVISGVLTTTYLVPNLSPGIYKFKVIAVNAQAQGPDSNIAQGILCGTGTCIDYAGADWIISSNQNISGLHYNIGIFRVNAGITAGCVLGSSISVYANQYQGLGNINATACGYRGGNDGHASYSGLGPGGATTSAGGGHGGIGGSWFGSAGVLGGASYGSISHPIDLGSGGGAGSGPATRGGNGGGAIKIIASGDIDIAGSILATGGIGVDCFYVGGGSGGSVLLQAGGQMRGAGIIRANGGDGACSAASGAGGRIALYYGNTIFSGTVTANAGNGSNIGGAGTIWQGNTVSGARLLTINNGDIGSINNPITRIEAGSFSETTLQNLTITGRANVVLDKSLTIGTGGLSLGSTSRLQQNVPLNVNSAAAINISGIWQQAGNVIGGNVTVASGGLITHNLNPAVGTKQVGIDMSLTSLTVASGGNIDVTGLGYRGGLNGHASYTGLGPGGATTSAGGGHGGIGGSWFGSAGVLGGTGYGSISQPVDLGSGGGAGSGPATRGGNGGGAIKIVASGDIDIAGNVLATGGIGVDCFYVGGGSGGSVWLQAGGQMRGAGIIRANGGDGACSAASGAGGRIALYYGNTIFSGTVTANAGTAGANIGGAGTIWQGNTVSGARLLAINNGNIGSINNPITTIEAGSFSETTLQNLTVTGRANVVLNKSLTIGGANLDLGSDSRLTQNAAITGGPSMTSFSLGSGAIWQQNAEMSGVSLTNMSINGTWIRDITQVFNQGGTMLTVANGGLITHGLNPAVGTQQRGLDMVLAGLVVQSGGNIDVTGLGYRGGLNGHASYSGLGSGGATTSAGGGYGGIGGSWFGSAGVLGGAQYGSISQPVDLGSGGGAGSSPATRGGNGGGAIKIIASGDIDIAGNVLATGGIGVDCFYVGGGSGGSVWLQAGGQMRGAGIIRANGGDGACSAASGAGGRIALYYGNTIFSGTVTANAGNGANIGGAGTIWQGNTVSGARLLAINNGNIGSINNPITTIEAGSFSETTLQNLTITGRANVVLNKSLTIGTGGLGLGSDSRLQQNVSLNANSAAAINISGIWQQAGTVIGGNVTVASGGLITHNLNPAVGTKQVGIDMSLTSLTVASGGNIDVTGLGYRGGLNGHASYTGLGSGGGTTSTGGGHGGIGGAWFGNVGVSGGTTYGSATNPVELGSGGGAGNSPASRGGNGGGAIKIVASGDIDIAGSVLATGGIGVDCFYVGGGSGGSVWLQAGGQMRGAGIIRANGGDGTCSGASGAGGRIALYYGNTIFSGTLTANAGNGSNIGGAGTVYQ